MKYITVLDFETGRVYQYSSFDGKKMIIDFNPEKYLTDKGHNLNNIEWMAHNNKEIIKE
jgi:hypothetical protein